MLNFLLPLIYMSFLLLDLRDDNCPRNSKIGKKKCRIQNHADSLDLISSHLKTLSKEDNYLSHTEQDTMPNQRSHKYIHYFKEQENELDSIFQTDNSLLAWDHPISQCKPEVSEKSAEDYFLVDEVTAGEKCCSNADDVNFSSFWEKDSFEVDLGVSSGSTGIALSSGSQQFSDEKMSRDGKKPFLKSCSLQRFLPQERALCSDAWNFESDCFKMKQILTRPCDRVHMSETDSSYQSSDILSRTLREDKASSFQPFPTAEFDNFPRAVARLIPLYEMHLDKNDGFSSDSVTKVETMGSDHLNLDSEWCSSSLDSVSRATTRWDVDHYTDINIFADGNTSGKTAGFKHFMDSEEDNCRYSNDMLEKKRSQEKYTTSCSYSRVADAGSGEFLERHDLNNKFPSKSVDILATETDWLSFDLLGKDHVGSGMYKSRRDTCFFQDNKRNFHFSKGRPRSHSAPPFCRSKRRFFTLNCHSLLEAGNGPAYPGSFCLNFPLHI